MEEITYKPEPKTNADLLLKPGAKTKKRNVYLYAVVATANLLAFATGITIGWPTPVIPKLLKSPDNPLERIASSSETAWLAGLLLLGGSTGSLVTKLADRIGRKHLLLVLGCVQVVSTLIAMFAKTIFLYYISRFLAGVSVGSFYPVIGMFFAEISENHNRGALSCTMSIFVGLGLNFSLIVGPYLTIQNFCVVWMIPLVIFLPTFLILSPETPAFLASINDRKRLGETLSKLRNKTFEEIDLEMTNMLEGSRPVGEANSRFKILLTSRASRKGLLISLMLVIVQQASSYSAVLAYMPVIFESAGGKLPPEVATMIAGSFQVAGVILSSILVDRAGRRFLLLASSSGITISLGLLGLYFYVKDKQMQIESFSWLPVVCLIIFVVAFSIGLGPVTVAVIAELFPSNLRSLASSISTFVCFITGFIVCLVFPSLSLHLGMAKCFGLFSLVCMGGTLFIYWILPETKKKSFEEIQKLLEGNLIKRSEYESG